MLTDELVWAGKSVLAGEFASVEVFVPAAEFV